MAKANLTAVSTETLRATTRLLEGLTGSEHIDHIHAAEAVERIAELLFDDCQHNEERMTDLQVAGLCSALRIISKWQSQQTYKFAECAEEVSKELGVEL